VSSLMAVRSSVSGINAMPPAWVPAIPRPRAPLHAGPRAPSPTRR